MLDLKNRFLRIKKSHLKITGVFLLILLAVCFLWYSNSNSMQAQPALVADVYFDGEYCIDGGAWQPIVQGEHISSTEGDVTLRGNFHRLAPDGTYAGIYRGEIPVAFYLDHINLTIAEGEFESAMLDMENPIFGASSCGVSWTAYTFFSECDETIEITVHNPHIFGNENAIDEMLDGFGLWTGIDFEKETMKSGETQRDIGLLFIIVSLVFLGTALFSTLIHIKNSKIIWLLGILVMFAGIYLSYSAAGVSLWNESIVFNTTIVGASMMFYMFFISMLIVTMLRKTRKIGNLVMMLLGTSIAAFFVLPMVSDVFFYDTWLWWIAIQLAVNTVLAVCLLKEFFATREGTRWIFIGAFLPLLAFVCDVVGTWLGVWKGGVISMYVFIALFVVSMVMVLKLIPRNINAATKARELEMEKTILNAQLAESRISTMMSQIRPHFIYNTLGSIEQLCKLDPPKAGELVHNFSKYLRGNFGELDNPKPILMSKEMEHVHHYISIENVRFPDMTFHFEMRCEDFSIPALTVQPIVENAIKHGLMKLPKGGTIKVVSYETDTDYCISVVDDGVGFDTDALLDDRKHLGIRNIRERLKVMVNGSLEIESTVGVGTKVLIKIPKEVQQ